jgi:hypothetical protein
MQIRLIRNDAKQGTKKAGLWPVVAKTTVMMNVNHAPWLQGTFLRQKGEAIAHLYETVHPESEWFARYHDAMCFDQDLDLSSEPQALLDHMLDSKTFSSCGIYVSPQRSDVFSATMLGRVCGALIFFVHYVEVM